MPTFKDLTKGEFHRLTVISFAGMNKHHKSTWNCRCICGKEVVVTGNALMRNAVKSCGCLIEDNCGKSKRAKLMGIPQGRLMPLYDTGEVKGGGRVWMCRCECDRFIKVTAECLTSGNTKSCGCLSSEKTAQRNRENAKHGLYNHTIYKRWDGIIQRCTNPNSPAWKNYGGRGIRICDRWRHSFEDFLADVGFPPNPKLEIDRINNDGHYEPGNVRWATRSQQAKNRRKVACGFVSTARNHNF